VQGGVVQLLVHVTTVGVHDVVVHTGGGICSTTQVKETLAHALSLAWMTTWPTMLRRADPEAFAHAR